MCVCARAAKAKLVPRPANLHDALMRDPSIRTLCFQIACNPTRTPFPPWQIKLGETVLFRLFAGIAVSTAAGQGLSGARFPAEEPAGVARRALFHKRMHGMYTHEHLYGAQPGAASL